MLVTINDYGRFFFFVSCFKILISLKCGCSSFFVVSVVDTVICFLCFYYFGEKIQSEMHLCDSCCRDML